MLYFQDVLNTWSDIDLFERLHYTGQQAQVAITSAFPPYLLKRYPWGFRKQAALPVSFFWNAKKKWTKGRTLISQSAQSCQQGVGFHAAADVATDHETIEHSGHLGSTTSICWGCSHWSYLGFCKLWPSVFSILFLKKDYWMPSINWLTHGLLKIYFIFLNFSQSLSLWISVQKVTRLNRRFQDRIENLPTGHFTSSSVQTLFSYLLCPCMFLESNSWCRHW